MKLNRTPLSESNARGKQLGRMLVRSGLALNATRASLVSESDERIEQLRRAADANPGDEDVRQRYEAEMQRAGRLPELIKRHLDVHRQAFSDAYHFNPDTGRLEQRRGGWTVFPSTRVTASVRHATRLSRAAGALPHDFLDKEPEESLDQFKHRALYLNSEIAPAVHVPGGEGRSTVYFADRGFPVVPGVSFGPRRGLPRNAVRISRDSWSRPSDAPSAEQQADSFGRMWQRAGGRVRRVPAADGLADHVTAYEILGRREHQTGDRSPVPRQNVVGLGLLHPRSYWDLQRGR